MARLSPVGLCLDGQDRAHSSMLRMTISIQFPFRTPNKTWPARRSAAS
jgi:hypothetical protein